MNNELWADALNEISDAYIEEATEPRKRKTFPWFGAIAGTLAAAMLAVILSPLFLLPLLFGGAGSAPSQDLHPTTSGTTHTTPTTLPPLTIDAELISLSAKPRNQIAGEKSTVRSQVQGAKAQHSNFFRESSRLVLSEAEGNALWSPANAYMALATTTRLTAGETRQELLDALGAADLDSLTTHAAAIWEAIYYNNEYSKTLLANSIWLDDALTFNQEPLDSLAYDLYTSVYQADLGTADANTAIQNWVNANTGNLLTDATGGIELPEEAALALYSTIYFQAKWTDEFSPGRSEYGFFHSPEGDIVCTFMKKKAAPMRYCWGDGFGAVSMALENGATMWFILPDEGVTVDQLLAAGDYMTMATAGYDDTVGDYNWRDYTDIKVNLSVPKFDISTQAKLDTMLQELGIEKAFRSEEADFSEVFTGNPVWLQGVNQAVRVAIDEEGVIAAAYTEIPVPGSPPPPEEVMDFILDRPFLFVIIKEDIPLFAGVVNEP